MSGINMALQPARLAARPLTPALSPEYRGEGVEKWPELGVKPQSARFPHGDDLGPIGWRQVMIGRMPFRTLSASFLVFGMLLMTLLTNRAPAEPATRAATAPAGAERRVAGVYDGRSGRAPSPAELVAEGRFADAEAVLRDPGGAAQRGRRCWTSSPASARRTRSTRRPAAEAPPDDPGRRGGGPRPLAGGGAGAVPHDRRADALLRPRAVQRLPLLRRGEDPPGEAREQARRRLDARAAPGAGDRRGRAAGEDGGRADPAPGALQADRAGGRAGDEAGASCASGCRSRRSTGSSGTCG